MTTDSVDTRVAEALKTATQEQRADALQKHLKEIVEGEAFKGSHRSVSFLNYIVEKAISGHFDSLKERVIGAQLFGRPPSYDTGQDAIVRVAASDVRRRLQQHYSGSGTASKFRINLPQGSYIPEIVHDDQSAQASPDTEKAYRDSSLTSAAPAHDSDSQLSLIAMREQVVKDPAMHGAATALSKRRSFAVLLAAVVVLLTVLNIFQWDTKRQAVPYVNPAPTSVLPWSALFNSSSTTHLITSDVDIVRIQRLNGDRVSVSDYANRRYFPQHDTLTPENKSYLMQGDKSATEDTQITASIAELAGSSARRIDVEGARKIKFSDLETDDNFIFLGSPFSDPWFSVFNDQLDFQFVPGGDRGLGPESIRNVHPKSTEQSIYAPTAGGGATGESYAIVALVGNHSQYGQVLLLAGISGEGTLAAGRLVTDLPRLLLALQRCGISSPASLKHFEMLLRVKLMAGSPSEYDVVACHILLDPSAH